MKTNYSQRFAISKKGHDKGTVYVIVSEENDYVYLCDGKIRKILNPKKKKKRHIKCLGANKISEYISEETPITDGRLRRAIRSFKADNEKLFEESEKETAPCREEE